VEDVDVVEAVAVDLFENLSSIIEWGFERILFRDLVTSEFQHSNRTHFKSSFELVQLKIQW